MHLDGQRAPPAARPAAFTPSLACLCHPQDLISHWEASAYIADPRLVGFSSVNSTLAYDDSGLTAYEKWWTAVGCRRRLLPLRRHRCQLL